MVYLLFLPSVWLFSVDPVLFDGFFGSCNGKRIVGNILGDYRACRRVGIIADLNGSDKTGITADECVVTDLGSAFILAVVVGCRTAAADSAVRGI